MDSSQSLYVANNANATVTVYDLQQEKFLRTITNSVSSPTALALDSGDNLYVLNNPPRSTTVSVYEAGTARVLRVISKHLNVGGAFAIDASDNLYVGSVTTSGSESVLEYAAGTSKLLRKIDTTPPNGVPLGLAFGP